MTERELHEVLVNHARQLAQGLVTEGEYVEQVTLTVAAFMGKLLVAEDSI
jgi:hypothetical protein